MNLFTNSIKVFLISFFLVACDNSGGVWLGEGESNGKSYTFGNQTEIETLQNLASAYSEKNPEKLSSYYSDEYMSEKRKEIWDGELKKNKIGV